MQVLRRMSLRTDSPDTFLFITTSFKGSLAESISSFLTQMDHIQLTEYIFYRIMAKISNFADFLFCLGILHRIPTNTLDEVRNLKKFFKKLLIYLYYSLNNQPYFFYLLLSLATIIRKAVSKNRNSTFRSLFTLFGTLFIPLPFIRLGNELKPFGLSRHAPLHEAYNGKSLRRIRQDVFDSFFTRIEQRVSRKEVLSLENMFYVITISEHSPYWHFLCEVKD